MWNVGAARPSLLATAQAGLVVVRDLPILRLLCLLTLVLAFAIFPATHLWSPRLQALSGQGMWLMGWSGRSSTSRRSSGRCSRACSRQLVGSVVLTFVTLWRGVMLGVAGCATAFYPALAGLVLLELGFGLSEPILQAWMNEARGERATLRQSFQCARCVSRSDKAVGSCGARLPRPRPRHPRRLDDRRSRRRVDRARVPAAHAASKADRRGGHSSIDATRPLSMTDAT